MLKQLDLNWTRIKHSAVGGVTNVQNWLGLPHQWRHHPTGVYSKRFLIHLIYPAARMFQSEHPPPVDEHLVEQVLYQEGVVSSLGLLPIDNPTVKVLVPSVFTATKWIVRKLTVKELSECLDQNQHVIEQSILNQYTLAKLPFVASVPNKTVQFAMRLAGFMIIKYSTRPKVELSPLPHIEVTPILDQEHLKAVKADAALVDNRLWDTRVIAKFSHLTLNDKTVRALDRLRIAFARCWSRLVVKSFHRYLKFEYGAEWCGSDKHQSPNSQLNIDIAKFVDCAYVASNASWFDWDAGSCLFFWRWQKEYRINARDGLPM